jgi:hypothetical protein
LAPPGIVICLVEDARLNAAPDLAEGRDPSGALHEGSAVEQHPSHCFGDTPRREVKPLLSCFAGQQHQWRLIMGEGGPGEHVRRVVHQVYLLRRTGAVDKLAEDLEKVRLGRYRQPHVPVDVAEPLDRVAQGDRFPVALPVVGREQELRRGVPPRTSCLPHPRRLNPGAHEALAIAAGSAIRSEISSSRSASDLRPM